MSEAFERLLDERPTNLALWGLVLPDLALTIAREWRSELMSHTPAALPPMPSSYSRRMLGLLIDVTLAWFVFWTTFDLLDRYVMLPPAWCNAPSMDDTVVFGVGPGGCLHDQEGWGALGGVLAVTVYATLSMAVGRSVGSLVSGTRMVGSSAQRPGLRIALAKVGLWYALMLASTLAVGLPLLAFAFTVGPEHMPASGAVSRAVNLAAFFGGPAVMYLLALRGAERRTLVDRLTGTCVVR